jgi:hypothetical protein
LKAKALLSFGGQAFRCSLVLKLSNLALGVVHLLVANCLQNVRILAAVGRTSEMQDEKS